MVSEQRFPEQCMEIVMIGLSCLLNVGHMHVVSLEKEKNRLHLLASIL